MKKAILSLLVFSFGLFPIFGQSSKAKSPFSKLGYEKQVMFTSSKGEFEEFHNNADIVEIGSVYFNTKTNEVVGFVDEKKEKTEVTSATSAMSIDPLCEKYYWISPYAYCMDNPVRFIDPTGMDWVENKETGNVEWKKEYTKDNVPDGYKYIGETYKGITIKNYDLQNYKTKDGSYTSLTVDINYTDPNTNKQSNYNWIQTVERDDEKSFVDTFTKEGDDYYPYYQDFSENKKSRNQDGVDLKYHDDPDELDKNGYFKAELSLIGDPVGIQIGNKGYLNTLPVKIKG